ncbi:beta-glucosidase family protein [Mucilaginibacter sp. E4BP6]|uniref:beta-glucosidase family protein n=1 Tax=Mucilaginibacter sp. E4BP6 TaxID=2723089 RepID=UPI0015CEC348|nr:glycoside hydrolase family 3 C-terminal domain-containing protein [Mucilaginibacter sp. E4BP6]NYE66933.1 beta-glucosidase [Mucilaginibacter sp. E4BP6]
MKIPLRILLLFLLGSYSLSLKAQTNLKPLPQLGHNTVKEVIAAMTVEEKATLLVGAESKKSQRKMSDGTAIGQTEIKVSGAAGNTAAIPRLGIPSMVFADGPAGIRIAATRKGDTLNTYYATGFPVGSLLASTWNTGLVTKVGKAMGNEVKEYSVDILLAPGINIHRNPLNGRNFEYYSEDPVVAGKMAAAMINGIQSNGVGTSVKHFIANNQETSRGSINVIVSERALREIYLKNFRIAITESNPWTVMSSYNQVNGVYTSERRDLLTTVLRDEWKYEGFVMTDWFGGRDWIAQMKAGNDLLMPGRPNQVQALIEAVKNNSLSEKVLDINVEHMLNIILKSPAFKNYKYSNKPDLKAHAQIAREAATEGMVLLKNNAHTLPFAKSVKTVAAFGDSFYNPIAGGYGSGDVNKAYVISGDKGLLDAGYQIDSKLSHIYAEYFRNNRDLMLPGITGVRPPAILPEMVVADNDIDESAANSDLALITIGRNAGEGEDRKLDGNYDLTVNEIQQIKKIATRFHAGHKKVVVVLNIGGVVDVSQWKDDVDAILLAWQPGQEAGYAIADILSGKVNPSGKLPDTFPADYADAPSAKNFPGTPTEKPDQVIYQEGIYVGYRYYDSFNVKPLYEFGYGLSYTDFSVSDLKLSAKTLTNSLIITATVKNTGKVAGKEVVELYISAPTGSIDKPIQELKAFDKTRLLQPGEFQKFTFRITAADLASYHTDKSQWISDSGRYLVKLGVSSRDIRQSGTFNLSKNVVIETDRAVLQPQVAIEEYKPPVTK